ncbi:endonuclease/exonuclease/phosphatase family protein [Caldibacillus lycopersici]|uniref:Endonuclease/exonuclease/phosphatase family protein n=1 Tax=Perspicuibacillus lycopersici TaxID=1325689 RepID=A0AAE3LLS2_9BACI|nr:endonuclease/exonuclease/phosphatase family protein [Perspicuibacillus lycopersici]MCU9612685.1 endonuclease/exonuclease/phosphatase family protein [Perspicuibacillus lycopersici]
MEFSVMTYNLRVDIPNDRLNAWSFRQEKVVKMIEKHKPIIIGTQEGLLYMLEALEENLPEYEWIGEGRRGGKRDEYCAIFYQKQLLQVVDNGQFWLSEQPLVANSISWESDFPRICTWVRFRFLADPMQQFIVYNTHLDHISQKARENGIHLILEKIKEHQEKTNLPIILMGDFNSTPENNVIRFLHGTQPIHNVVTELRDAYEKLQGQLGSTYHAFEGVKDGEPIDYIFVTNNIQVLETKIDRDKIENSFPSDHYPVITRVQL